MAKILTGKVISTKMIDTVVVKVVRSFRHPLYQKIIKKAKKFKCDCKGIKVAEGDIVTIVETRPISKEKHFRIISVENK